MSKRRRLVTALLGLTLLLGVMAGLAVWWYHTSRPEHRLRRGQEALRQGNWEAAERLSKRLETSGYRDHAHLLRGESFFRLARYASAIEEFNHIQDQDAIRLEAAAITGKCFLYLKDLREAERAFRFVLEQNPAHVDAHRGLGALYFDQGAMLPAIQHWKEVVRLDPDDGRPYRTLGLIFKDMTNYAEALDCYQKALERTLSDPAIQDVVVEKTECLLKRKDYQQAFETISCCDAHRAQTSEVHTLRAQCLWGLGRRADAQTLLEEVLSRPSPPAAALRLRAQVHLEVGEAKAAAHFLEQAQDIEPFDHEGRYQLALAYEILGRRADAAEQRRRLKETEDALRELAKLNEAALADPWNADIRLRLAEACRKLDRPDLAAMWQEAAAACSPPQRPAK